MCGGGGVTALIWAKFKRCSKCPDFSWSNLTPGRRTKDHLLPAVGGAAQAQADGGLDGSNRSQRHAQITNIPTGSLRSHSVTNLHQRA